MGIVTKKVHFMGGSRTMGVNRYSKECGKSWVRAPCQVDPSNVYKLGFSAKHAVFTSKSKDWLGKIRIMCLSGVTCLPTDYCFTELTIKKSN